MIKTKAIPTMIWFSETKFPTFYFVHTQQPSTYSNQISSKIRKPLIKVSQKIWVVYTFFLLLFFSASLSAQKKDTVKIYDLDEITVQSGNIIEPKPTTRIGSQVLEKYDGISLFEVAKYIPSIKPQTNSRGESLFYLRGSNERQLGLFFDGAFLNIPWDNRIDLSLLPTTNFEELKIIKGVPSIIYGANSIAGVVIGSSKKITNSKLSGNFNTLLGLNNFQKFNLSMSQKINNFSFLISASHFKRDAFALPSHFNSDENLSSKRLNSYLRTSSIFAKSRYEYSDLSNIELSVQYLDSKKNVPPEIGIEDPRFWKYPNWNKVAINILGKQSFNFNSTSFLDYNFNIYKFKMEINQFTDNTYSVIEEIEKNNDFVFSGRLIYTHIYNLNSILRFSISGYSTTHAEEFLSTQFIKNNYNQFLYSSGVEYELISNNFTFIGGISYDGTTTTKAGIFEVGNPLSGIGFSTTLKYNFTKSSNIQINFGRKSRFPSLRESYSDGLGRFVRNPNLSAETVTDTELGVEFLFNKGRIFSNIFLAYLTDGIVRTVVQTNFGNKFMRINKEKIRTYGAEFEGEYNIWNNTDVGFNFSYLNSHAINENKSYSDTLEYRPEIISNLHISSSIYRNFSMLFETTVIANEYALKDGSLYFQKLPQYFLFNIRVSYLLIPAKTQTLELYARVNNIFDRLYYTQFGLPEAGREFWVGLNFLF